MLFRADVETLNLDLSPDGARLATCCGPKVTIWDTTTWSEIKSYFGHASGSYVYSVRWDSVGRYLVTASSDGTARIWNTETHTLAHALRGHQAVVKILGFSSDDTRLITRSDKVHVWHVPTGREILAYPLTNESTDTNEFQIANRRIRKLEKLNAPFLSLARAERLAEDKENVDQTRHNSLHELARSLLARKQDGYDPDRALVVASRAVELSPETSTYLTTLAWAKYRTGDFAGARSAVKEAIKKLGSGQRPGFRLKSTSVETQLLLAICEFALGNKDAAHDRYRDVAKNLDSDSIGEELLDLIRSRRGKSLVNQSMVARVLP